VPLIAIAKRYGLVACVSGRRAATARRIVSLGSHHLCGQPRLGDPARRLDGTRDRPRGGRWTGRVAAFSDAAYTDRLHRLRVRMEDKELIRAFHWRGAPTRPQPSSAVRDLAQRARTRGSPSTGGARC
jgi:trehalose 6-phosphate phosphatase